MNTSSSDGVVGRAEWTSSAGLAQPGGEPLGLGRGAPGRRAGQRGVQPLAEHLDLGDAGRRAQRGERLAPRLGDDLDHHARLAGAQRVRRVDGEHAGRGR